MKAYPKYKDSGIEWLGVIPTHWEVLRIKRLSRVKRGASPRPIDDPKYFDENGEFGWVRIADVTASERYLEKTTQILSELGSSLSVKQYPGDFFVSIAGTVGKPIITKIKCCIHDGFVWFPDFQINQEFFYYIFSAGELYKGLGKWGTQLNLNTETIGDIYIALPPLKNEIENIVKYLDHKTRLIDTYIAKKQQQIALLQKYRTALINQMVTKGLNPDAPMKDSGVEWLGEIPAHWEVVKLKFLTTKVGSGITPRGGATVYQEVGIPLLRSQNIHFDGLKLDEVAYIPREIHDSMSNTKIQLDDVLLNITGASIGRCYYVDENLGEANVNQHVCIIRPNSRIETRFLFNMLASQVGQFQVFYSQNGTSREGLNFEQLKNFIVPLPPQREQLTLVQLLDRINDRIFVSVGKLKRQIERFQAYRTTLISDAVTGKIDVRTTRITHKKGIYDNYRDCT